MKLLPGEIPPELNRRTLLMIALDTVCGSPSTFNVQTTVLPTVTAVITPDEPRPHGTKTTPLCVVVVDVVVVVVVVCGSTTIVAERPTWLL